MDIEDFSDDQLREVEYKGYEMDATDKHNVAEIKQLLDSDGYKTEEQALDHMHYLEALVDKMEDAYKIELPVRNNLTLMADIKSVRKLTHRLMEMLENF